MESLNLFGILVLSLSIIEIKGVAGQSRIVGGYKANDDFSKFHASLQNLSGRHVCGGAVVGPKHILTAAHCVYGAQPENIVAVIGTTNLDKGGKNYNVSSINTHEKFNFELRIHDIALIKMKKNLSKCRARIIKLHKQELVTGESLILTGFGSQAPDGETSRIMYALDLNVFDQETCRYAMRNVRNVEDEMFCTFSSIGQGTCHGDSGGPLVKDGELIGLVSWGIPCAVGFPDVHTRIYPYIYWIQKQLCNSMSVNGTYSILFCKF